MEAEQKATPEVVIRFLDGPLAEQIISIERLVTMIGRDRQNDIVILDPRAIAVAGNEEVWYTLSNKRSNSVRSAERSAIANRWNTERAQRGDPATQEQ